MLAVYGGGLGLQAITSESSPSSVRCELAVQSRLTVPSPDLGCFDIGVGYLQLNEYAATITRSSSELADVVENASRSTNKLTRSRDIYPSLRILMQATLDAHSLKRS